MNFQNWFIFWLLSYYPYFDKGVILYWTNLNSVQIRKRRAKLVKINPLFWQRKFLKCFVNVVSLLSLIGKTDDIHSKKFKYQSFKRRVWRITVISLSSSNLKSILHVSWIHTFWNGSEVLEIKFDYVNVITITPFYSLWNRAWSFIEPQLPPPPQKSPFCKI